MVGLKQQSKRTSAVDDVPQSTEKTAAVARESDSRTTAGQDVREVVLDIAIAIAVFVVLQLLGVPFWARLLLCFLSDYFRVVYSSFSSHSLLGNAKKQLKAMKKVGIGDTTEKADVQHRPDNDIAADVPAGVENTAALRQTQTHSSPRRGGSIKVTPKHAVKPSVAAPKSNATISVRSPRRGSPRTLKKQSAKIEVQNTDSAEINRSRVRSPKAKRSPRKLRTYLDRGSAATPNLANKQSNSQTESKHTKSQHHKLRERRRMGVPETKIKQRRKRPELILPNSSSEAPPPFTTNRLKKSPRRSLPKRAGVSANDGRDDAGKMTRLETPQNLELDQLLRIGDESEFEDQMRNFQSRLQESITSPNDRRARRSEQLKTVIDPGTFAKLLANKKKHLSKKLNH